MPSGAKPTHAVRAEGKFIFIMPYKKEENKVKSRAKRVILSPVGSKTFGYSLRS